MTLLLGSVLDRVEHQASVDGATNRSLAHIRQCAADQLNGRTREEGERVLRLQQGQEPGVRLERRVHL